MTCERAVAAVVLGCAVLSAQVAVGVPSPVGREVAESGETLAVSSPVLGYTLSRQAGKLRVLAGIAGTSAAGQLMQTGQRAADAAVSPRLDYAIGATAEGSAFLLDLQTGKSQTLPVMAIARVAISPSGTAVALYSASARAVYVFTGMPALSAPRQVDASAAENVAALAVSDDGGSVLLGGTGVYLAEADKGLRTVLVGAQVSALAFAGASTDAVAADAAADRVFFLRQAGISGAEIIADREAGVSKPSDVAVSQDGRRVFVANAGAKNVLEIAAATREVRATDCACEPVRLARLAGQEAFLVTEGDGPMFVFDTGAEGSRITSVLPPDVEANGR